MDLSLNGSSLSTHVTTYVQTINGTTQPIRALHESVTVVLVVFHILLAFHKKILNASQKSLISVDKAMNLVAKVRVFTFLSQILCFVLEVIDGTLLTVYVQL